MIVSYLTLSDKNLQNYDRKYLKKELFIKHIQFLKKNTDKQN